MTNPIAAIRGLADRIDYGPETDRAWTWMSRGAAAFPGIVFSAQVGEYRLSYWIDHKTGEHQHTVNWRPQ